MAEFIYGIKLVLFIMVLVLSYISGQKFYDYLKFHIKQYFFKKKFPPENGKPIYTLREYLADRGFNIAIIFIDSYNIKADKILVRRMKLDDYVYEEVSINTDYRPDGIMYLEVFTNTVGELAILRELASIHIKQGCTPIIKWDNHNYGLQRKLAFTSDFLAVSFTLYIIKSFGIHPKIGTDFNMLMFRKEVISLMNHMSDPNQIRHLCLMTLILGDRYWDVARVRHNYVNTKLIDEFKSTQKSMYPEPI